MWDIALRMWRSVPQIVVLVILTIVCRSAIVACRSSRAFFPEPEISVLLNAVFCNILSNRHLPIFILGIALGTALMTSSRGSRLFDGSSFRQLMAGLALPLAKFDDYQAIAFCRGHHAVKH